MTFELRRPEEGSSIRSVELARTFPATVNPVVYGLKVRVCTGAVGGGEGGGAREEES